MMCGEKEDEIIHSVLLRAAESMCVFFTREYLIKYYFSITLESMSDASTCVWYVGWFNFGSGGRSKTTHKWQWWIFLYGLSNYCDTHYVSEQNNWMITHPHAQV